MGQQTNMNICLPNRCIQLFGILAIVLLHNIFVQRCWVHDLGLATFVHAKGEQWNLLSHKYILEKRSPRAGFLCLHLSCQTLKEWAASSAAVSSFLDFLACTHNICVQRRWVHLSGVRQFTRKIHPTARKQWLWESCFRARGGKVNQWTPFGGCS